MSYTDSNTRARFLKKQKQQKIFVVGSLTSLLAACGASSPVPNVKGTSTSGDDILTPLDNNLAAIIDGGAGDDDITGGNQIDFIRGGTGSDVINSGAGVDNIVVIGITGVDEYTLLDIENPNGTNIDLTKLISLQDLNDHATSDLSVGDIIDGDADGAILFIYGNVDFTGVALANITRLDVHSQVTIPVDVLNGLLEDSNFKELIGDGTSHLEIPDSSSPITLNFSAVDMQGITHLTIGENVTLIINSSDVASTLTIDGDGSIQAVSGFLDLDGKQIGSNIEILDAGGNIARPVFDGNFSVDFNENSTNVGVFSVTDESSVGDVTYAISGVDAGLFNINTSTGEIDFKSAPDFENPTDVGADNVYDLIITATDEYQESIPQNIIITVVNANDGPTGSVTVSGLLKQGGTAYANNTLSDEDGLGTISYQWQADGVNISGATDGYYDLDQAVVGKTIELVASYTDGQGADENVTSASTVVISNVNDAPSGAVSFSGTTSLGKTLTASHSLADIDGLGVISYQWQADGVDISGATNATYTLNMAEVGTEVSVLASYTDGYGEAESVASASSNITMGSSFGLDLINGTNGFRIDGDNPADSFGYSVSSAGDVNGDGYDDVIVGAYGSDNNLSNSGSGYLIFGQASGFSSTVDLSALDGTDGYRIDGVGGGDNFGYSVSSAGDVNGDGYDDIIVGAEATDYNGLNSGSSYVVFGQATYSLATLSLASLSGVNGFRIDGTAAGEFSGYSVSSAGDVNGDGYDDVLIGAYGADGLAGESYVVFGQSAAFSATMDLSSLNGTNSFVVNGVSASDFSGYSVSAAGDVNGDGFDDILIGAYGADNNGLSSGSSYVVFGQSSYSSASFDLSSLNGTNGFRIDGDFAVHQSGFSVSSAGDVNGDGYDDVIIGVHSADYNGRGNSGSSYVVFGQSSAFSATMDLSTLNGTDGFRIDGAVAGEFSGASVSSAGDINGDGYDDLIIGAYEADNNGETNSGSSYIVFGQATGFSSTMDLSTLDGTTGFRIDGISEDDVSGTSVSSAGDINGDGYDDLIIGAPDDDLADSGSSYVIFGGTQFSASVNAATAGVDSVIGTASSDVLNAGDGGDGVVGLAGDDILIGGNGVDAILAGDGADRIWGGGGLDSFVFNAGGTSVTISGSGDAGQITGYDIIYDFKTNSADFVSEIFDTVGVASVIASTIGFVDGVDSGLTIDGNVVSKHSINNGIIIFDDDIGANPAIEVSGNNDIAAVIEYLQNQDLGDAGVTAAIDYGSDIFIYTQGSDDGVDNSLDVVVHLEDTQVDSLITSNAMGSFDLLIV